MTTIIFPFVGREAEAYDAAAAERGESTARIYPDMLPSIHDEGFAVAFENCCIVFRATHIFCPVASVHHFMSKFIAHNRLPLRLIGKSPIQKAMDEHKTLMRRANELQPLAKIPVTELAGILKIAMNIYGESSDEKIAAMIGVFDDSPKSGHVVEIGCLAGRTAFVLGQMSERSRIRSLMTVDPWSAGSGVQHDSPSLLTEMTNEWDWDVLAEMFEVSTSVNRNKDRVRASSSSSIFQLYSFCVSVLHIDGNHDYASVKDDCVRWAARILPGGWLILDDYEWAHGDGPKRAGDELLQERAHEIKSFFVCGGALFVKFKETTR